MRTSGGMDELLAIVRSLVARYLLHEDGAMLFEDRCVQLMRTVLHLSKQPHPGGPRDLHLESAADVAALHLCRCQASGSDCDHTAALSELVQLGITGSAKPVSVLTDARGCLIARGWARITDRDSAALLADETDAEMRLLERVGACLHKIGLLAEADHLGPYLIAQQCWLRYWAQSAEDGEPDLRRALQAFEDTYEEDRTIVPPLVREYLRAVTAPTEPAPVADQSLRHGVAHAMIGKDRARTARDYSRAVLRARRAMLERHDTDTEIDLARLLSWRGLALRSRGDLDEAIVHGFVVADALGRRYQALPAILAELLLQSLVTRADLTGENDDLVRAVGLAYQVLGSGPAVDPGHARLLGWLASGSSQLATRTNDPRRLNYVLNLVGAVATADDDTVPVNPDVGKLRAECAFLASAMWHERYRLSEERDDLDAAISWGARGLELARDHPEVWNDNAFLVAEAYVDLFELTHSARALDYAISLTRVLLLRAQSRDDGGMHLERQRLGLWLVLRYKDRGHESDRRYATELLTAVIEEIGDHEYPDRRSVLLTAASTIAASAESSEQELRNALSWGRQGIELGAEGPDEEARVRLILSQTLERLHHHVADNTLLDEAIEQATRACGASSAELTGAATAHLAFLLLIRDGADTPATLRALEEAAALAEGTPAAITRDARLSLALALLDRRDRDEAGRARAFGILESLARAPNTDRRVCLGSAMRWASEAVRLGDYRTAVDAWRVAIDRLAASDWWIRPRWERRELIGELQGVGRAAAACASRLGMYEHALESLERGRGLQWSSAHRLRAAVECAAAANPGLGDEVRKIVEAQQIHTYAADPDSFEDVMDGIGTVIHQAAAGRGFHDQHVHHDEAWQTLIAHAHTIPGLSELLDPPRADTLRGAATGGTAVVVNVSTYGSHALIVTPAGIDNVALPRLTAESCADVFTDFMTAVFSIDCGILDRESRKRLANVMTRTRRWLWQVIAEPVLDHLGLRQTPSAGETWPRIWWCPTAPLEGLPIHAAGDDEHGACVLDRVISSYTSTLGALMYSRASAAPQEPRILAIGANDVPGLPPITGVREELAALKRRFPEAVTSYEGEHALRLALLHEMPQCTWLHLACHATPGLGEHPASFYLREGRVLIERLTRGTSAPADLAFLSACHTVQAGMERPDEAEHLAAALQAAGFRHIVGTQWSANSRLAVRVAELFYDRLTELGTSGADRAAEALHHAVRSVRSDGEPPYLWAPYVHYGP